uniref:Uncharacterized protein n=1 Tax=Oryza brachyantha TaxID=4533 RepID=J3M4V0_ORYBR
MAPPHMATSMVIFFMAALILLASSSSCLTRARMMPAGDGYHANESRRSGSRQASPHGLLQEVAPPLLPSPPAAGAAAMAATAIVHPDSSGWMPQGSVPSPGIGHRV